ncbi:MAG: serine/threonine-protein kinase [Mariprofundaceae bacterium]
MPFKPADSHLGPYRLDSKLGEGGMGVVYQATDEKLHREVAIKVLHPNLLQHENLKERFRREARMHAKLMHPNVVTLLSVFEDDEHMAIVMEMVHGKNLKEHLRDNPNLSVADTVHIALAVLNGLEAAHQLSMVHRDLKPANVLIANDGGIKLMDFGLAKPEHGDDDLTQDGATVGSFRYMAPEQILNQPIDARTDLYAFGILLYQMFTGRFPFDSANGSGGEFEIMEKQVREEAVAPHEIIRDLPLEISDLILRLLAKSQDDRPQNCAAVREVLSLFQHSEQQPQRKMESVRIPRGPAQKMSNAEIAKGLAQAVVSSVIKTVVSFKDQMLNLGCSIAKLIKEKSKFIPIDSRWQAPLAWSSFALVMLLIGWGLVSIIHLADEPVEISSSYTKSEIVEDKPTIPSETIVEKDEPVVEKSVRKPTIKSIVKPITKTVKQPKVVKSKSAKKPVLRSITYRVKHKVMRSDHSKPVTEKRHEFRGGKHVYFKILKDYKWKESLQTKKKGETTVILEKPVRLSQIVLHKASVGRLSFKGGYVNLAVKDSRGHWHELFDRQNDDVDIAVHISKPRKYLKDVKAVRLRFKTPEPITIGPIDLLR